MLSYKNKLRLKSTWWISITSYLVDLTKAVQFFSMFHSRAIVNFWASSCHTDLANLAMKFQLLMDVKIFFAIENCIADEANFHSYHIWFDVKFFLNLTMIICHVLFNLGPLFRLKFALITVVTLNIHALLFNACQSLFENSIVFI
jgi:hypothetical protein